MIPTELVQQIVGGLVTVASVFTGMWLFNLRVTKAREERFREIAKSEQISEERVRSWAREEATLVVTRSAEMTIMGVELKFRSALSEHEAHEDERMVRALKRVETDAEKGLESLHADTERVLQQLAAHDRKIEALRRGFALNERDIAVLREREHLPPAPAMEPDTPGSKP